MDNLKSKDDLIDFNELLSPYMKRWKWFVISVFLFLILGVIYIKTSVPVYQTNASVLIKDAKKMSSASGDFGVLSGFGGFAGMGTNSIENELEIFKSQRIVKDAVQELKLQTTLYSREKFYDVELYKDTNPIIINLINEKPFEELPKKSIDIKISGDKITLSSDELKKPIQTTFNKTVSLPYANFIITRNPKFNRKKVKKLRLNDLYFNYSDMESVVNLYQKALDVDLTDKDATVIGLIYKNANRDKGEDFLNKLVNRYNEYAITDKNLESKKTKEFIDDRIVIISKELGRVETEKESFKISNDLLDIPSEASINMGIYNETRKRSLDIDTQIELTKMLLDFISSQTNTYQVLPTNVGLDNATATSNISAYNKLVIDRNRLLENATPENPLVQDVTKDLNSLRKAMRESLTRSLASLSVTKRQVSGENANSDYNIKKIPSQEKVYRNIERQQGIKENLYLLLLQKREEAAINMAITGDKARVIDYAYASQKPVSPKKMIILAFCMIVGVLVPFIWIYIRQLLNTKIVSKHDLEKLTSTTILAEIPRLNKRDNHLITFNDVSPLAEAFRILVTNIRFLLPQKDSAKVIFVTSSVKGEGKTFISVNLALAMASTPNKKVLVIGSDIRNPQLQRYNPQMKSSKGLSEYLYSEITDSSSIIHPSGFNPNCDFIYSGSIPPNPADLLQNGRYEELLNELKDKYEYIILDTAPLMLVTDSFLISSLADASIYVTRSEVTKKDFIDFANKNIESGKIKNTAFILNDVHKSNFGYGNNYGYGYSSDQKKWWQFYK